MYNTDLPTRAELPTTARLIRSTLLAIIAAFILLITVVLPSEYAIDPTGIGRILGLTEMGEIKEQLQDEAEADKVSEAIEAKESGLFEEIVSLFSIKSANAQTTGTIWREDITFTLTPGKGAEVKLVMEKGSIAEYQWIAEGGVANFDLHGDNATQSVTYEKGRGVASDSGQLQANFKGNHGWFWRNRDSQPITITLKVAGDYIELKRLK